jgi:hypothetical protein
MIFTVEKQEKTHKLPPQLHVKRTRQTSEEQRGMQPWNGHQHKYCWGV